GVSAGQTADGFPATGPDLGEHTHQGTFPQVATGGGKSVPGTSYKKTKEDQEKTRERAPSALPHPRPDAPAAIDAEITRMVADITGLTIDDRHAADLRHRLLAGRPTAAGNPLLYVQTTIRRLGDTGRAAELLPPSLIDAYEARTGRTTTRPAPSGPAKTALPDDFPITDAMRRWVAATFPGLDADHETAKFRDHHRAHGTRMADWHAAWQKWIRQAHDFATRRPATTTDLAPRAPTPRYRSTGDQRFAETQALKALYPEGS
ncbi:hypothetical protein, partial [Sphaerimonospora thailandensis]|uniref:hypothetical protein n=1 Tax=Sphaerimonospora thailandensis TaxID=795644 RepID=UPI0019528719